MSTLIPLLTEYEKEHISERQPLPERYIGLSDEEMDARIAAAKATLGRRLVILGHHYQRDEVIKFADYTGDSYKLARHVAQHPDAEFIVFCGVHFMAESADVLSAEHQQVMLPDLAAGCSMSDMAEPEQLEMCWRELEEMGVITRAGGPASAPEALRRGRAEARIDDGASEGGAGKCAEFFAGARRFQQLGNSARTAHRVFSPVIRRGRSRYFSCHADWRRSEPKRGYIQITPGVACGSGDHIACQRFDVGGRSAGGTAEHDRN
jgi:hypothetical protein